MGKAINEAYEVMAQSITMETVKRREARARERASWDVPKAWADRDAQIFNIIRETGMIGGEMV